MHAMLLPVQLYHANVRRLSSGRLAKPLIHMAVSATFPQTGIGLATLPPWSRRAGGGEDLRPPLPLAPLHDWRAPGDR